MAFKKINDLIRDFSLDKERQEDLRCADCGVKITKLPFKPIPGRPIYCRDCYAGRKRKSLRQ